MMNAGLGISALQSDWAFPVVQPLFPAEIALVFPFHLGFDVAGRIAHFGGKVPGICPGLRAGELLSARFEFLRPKVDFTPASFASLARLPGEFVLLRCRFSGRLLRGQVLVRSGGHDFLFLGAPCSAPGSAAEGSEGLPDTLAVASHPVGTVSGGEALPTIHALQAGMEGLRKLNEDLYRKNAELREANRELQERHAALQQQESHIRLMSLVASHTEHGIVITDVAGRTLWINAGFTQLTEYSLAELIGRTPGSVLQGPASDPGVVAYIRGRMRECLPFQAELINYTKSGRTYWVSLEVQPVYDSHGTVTNFLAIERDISERKRIEAELCSQRELLLATLSSMLDGIIVVDEHMRIRLVNAAAARITGWEPAAAEGRLLSEIFTQNSVPGIPGKQPETPTQWLSAAFSREAVVGDLASLPESVLLHTAKGECYSVAATAVPLLGKAGEISGGLLVLRDVSAGVELEQMREDLVQAVSHELRTPLTSILGFLPALLEDQELSRGKQLEFLNIINLQATRIRHLVENILEISRVESRNSTFVDVPLDLRQVAQASVQEVESQAGAKAVQILLDLPATPLGFCGDAMELQSVITNLLTNAIKFTPTQGTVDLQLRQGNGEFAIVVQDTGTGIPAEALDHIFEKFYRVRQPGSQVPGTGLGLAIVRRIVQHYHGHIEVESVPGAGACFRIYLPCSTARG